MSTSRTLTIVTPENIPIHYQAAGIASRFMALLVDLLIILVLFLGLSWLMNHLTAALGPGLGGTVSVVGILLSNPFAILFGYPLIFEAAWNGRTPGKRLFGLRVIRDGGYPITFVTSAVRNILRFIDFGLLPLGSTAFILCGLPGLACLFFSSKYKRIGDYAAGTLVIVEAKNSPFSEKEGAQMSSEVLAMLPSVRNLDRLTPAEYRAIRRFVGRRRALDWNAQAALGERLARPLMTKLEILPPISLQIQYADLLEAIERRYAEEYGVL